MELLLLLLQVLLFSVKLLWSTTMSHFLLFFQCIFLLCSVFICFYAFCKSTFLFCLLVLLVSTAFRWFYYLSAFQLFSMPSTSTIFISFYAFCKSTFMYAFNFHWFLLSFSLSTFLYAFNFHWFYYLFAFQLLCMPSTSTGFTIL